MSRPENFYETLGLSRTATAEQIRTSFRKLAQLHHPDKNPGSLDSEIRFRSIHEAYSVLSDEESKIPYDLYLDSSRIQRNLQKAATQRPSGPSLTPAENLCSQLNYIFWEIEDIFSPAKNTFDLDIRKYGGNSIRKWLLEILIFIDRWILTPAGYGDYFYQARLIDERESYDTIAKGFNPFLHNPYLSFSGYFYKLKTRFDKFSARITPSDLNRPVKGTDYRILDSFYETLNMSYHYLGAIQLVMSGRSDGISPFAHRRGFSQRETPRLLN